MKEKKLDCLPYTATAGNCRTLPNSYGNNDVFRVPRWRISGFTKSTENWRVLSTLNGRQSIFFTLSRIAVTVPAWNVQGVHRSNPRAVFWLGDNPYFSPLVAYQLQFLRRTCSACTEVFRVLDRSCITCCWCCFRLLSFADSMIDLNSPWVISVMGGRRSLSSWGEWVSRRRRDPRRSRDLTLS